MGVIQSNVKEKSVNTNHDKDCTLVCCAGLASQEFLRKLEALSGRRKNPAPELEDVSVVVSLAKFLVIQINPAFKYCVCVARS